MKIEFKLKLIKRKNNALAEEKEKSKISIVINKGEFGEVNVEYYWEKKEKINRKILN